MEEDGGCCGSASGNGHGHGRLEQNLIDVSG